MALFRNLCVNPPEADKSSELLVRRTTEYASAQFLDFLDLAKNVSFLDWKLKPVLRTKKLIYEWVLAKITSTVRPVG